MENRFKRGMAAFLAAIMFTSSIPFSAVAEDLSESADVPSAVSEETITVLPEKETTPAAEVPSERAAEPAAEPETEAATEPTTEATSEPATEPATEATSEPATEPATEAATEPVVQPSRKPKEESFVKFSLRSSGITLEMTSSQAYVCTLVDFAVSAPGADTYTLKWYDGERNLISTSEKSLTDGRGTFQSWVDEPCTEIIVVSAVIDGVTYTDEINVNYISRGKVQGVPTITSTGMPKAHQAYTVTWTAVEGADQYYLCWNQPAGERLMDYVEGTSYTVPARMITMEGEYRVRVAAVKDGYEIGDEAEMKLTVTESVTDDRVAITASQSQIALGNSVKISVSAPGAEAIRLYNITADSSWYSEETGDRHEWDYDLPATRTFYASALYDGTWVSGKSITVTVTSLGKLDAPILTMPSEISAGKDVTVSWTEVANAERYWVQLWHDDNGACGEFIEGFDPDGETSATLDHVLEPGSYRVIVLAIAEGYETGRSTDIAFAVTGELAAPPVLTLDAEKYVYGSKTIYTVTAEGAEAVRLRYYGIGDDGDSWNQSFAFDADGTTTVYEQDCYTAGSFHAVCSVRINGIWTAYCEPVPFEVRYLGELTAPVIEMKDSYAAGEEITVSWNAVENAEEYRVEFYNGDGTTHLRSFYLEAETSVTLDDILEPGSYRVDVFAQTEGYERGFTSAVFTVTGELAAPPSLSLDAEKYVYGSKITYTVTAEGAEQIRLRYYGTSTEGYSVEDTIVFDADGTTTEYKKYFYPAGSFQAVCSVKINGAWSAYCEPVSFEVSYLGELESPVLTMKDSYTAGAEIEVSWSAVENAESYGVSLYDSEGNHIKNWWIDAPETAVVMDMALEAGSYSVSVYARAQGWKSSEETAAEFTVTGQLAEGPSFTVESYTVVTGKNATFTVFMEGATKFRLLCDERVTEHAAENGAATITRTLYGSHKQVTAQISACVNGIWTDYGPSQSIYIVDKPLLGAVRVTVPETVRAGEDIEIIWEPVEHAENYSVRMETADEKTVWSDYIYAETEECRTVIPAGRLTQGSYILSVVAMAQEYSATGCNIQLDVQAPLPENAFRYYINSAGTEVQISEYLGNPVPEELEIPAAIQGATVVSIFGPLFENGCNGLRITIPASVTHIASYAFEGCTDLTICGYSGSQAEEYAILNDHAFEALDGGQTAISADWAEALTNKEMIFTVSAPGATEVVMYEGGNKEYYATVLLTDGGASVRWTPENTGIYCIRFEAKVDGQWLTTKNYALEVTSAGQMPQVRNLKPAAATVEPGTAVTITWDDPEGLTAPVYGVNVIRPGYDLDDYTYWNPVSPGKTSYTFSSYNFETEGTYLLAVRTEPAPGYEASVTTCTVEVKSTRLWDFNPDDRELLAYHGTDKEIVIPAEIDGVPVWYIAGSIFADSDITSVVIPEGVRHIYRGVFQNCTSLTSVSLPSTMSYIGEYAFYGCKSLAQITLPEKLSTLGYYAFYNCDALTSVTIPAGITELHTETFYSCDALTQVTLSDGLTEIGSSAFAFCSSLKTITIPQSVTTIDQRAFKYVEDLTICGYLGSVAEAFAGEQGYDFVALDSIQTGDISFTLERDTLYYGGLMKITVTAPDAQKLRLHLDGQVSECSISDGKTEILRYIHTLGGHTVTVSQCVDGKWMAPCEAVAFTVIEMEKPVIEMIPATPAQKPITVRWKPVEGAVSYTVYLTRDDVYLADFQNVQSLDKDGYVYQQLEGTLLAHEGIYNVQVTARAADSGSTNSSRTFEVTAAEEFLYEVNEDGTATLTGHTGSVREVVVPAQLDGHAVVKIAQKAFLSSNAVSIELPASVEVVEQWAFYGCEALETVKILESQATICMAAFKDCNKLVNIYIGAGVFLEDDALEGCRTDAVVYGYSGGRVEEVARRACGFSALGELAEGPVITAEDIWQNEKLNYTVALENASRLYIQEIYPDGRMDCFARGIGQTEEVADFYDFEDLEENCVVQIKASALVDGAWTAYQEKEVTVSVLGVLREPVFKEIGRLERHLDHEIRWYAVEKAEAYHVEIRKGRTIEKEMDLDASQTKISLNAGALSDGDYVITVTATAEGFVEASASAEFEVYSIKLNAPEITVDKRIARHLGATISWNDVPVAQKYFMKIQRENEDGTVTLCKSKLLEDTSFVLTPEELKLGNYTVSVEARAQYCTPSDEAIEEFEVYEEPLDAPEVTVPETVVGGISFDVVWKSVENAERYYLEIEDETGYRLFNAMLDSQAVTKTVCLDTYLPEGTLTLRVIASAHYRVNGVAEQTLVYKPLYSHKVVNGGAVITGYNGHDTVLFVPGKINGYEVTGIGDGAFENRDTLTEVYLPDSVAAIGDRSFKNCTSLQLIQGDGVTEIGEEAFYNCTSLHVFNFGRNHNYQVKVKQNAFWNAPIEEDADDREGLMDITISQQPEDDGDTGEGGSTDIPSHAGNLYIGSVTYEEGVTQIPERTHYSNIQLGWVRLPRSLRSIGSEAFAQCPVLKSVRLYDGIESIAENAFDGSPDVRFILYTSDMQEVSYAEQYAIDHGIPYEKYYFAARDERLYAAKYPDGTYHIGDRECFGETYLEWVKLPESLESIGSKAFAECGSLMKIYLYDGITSIADDAFEGSDHVQFVIYTEDPEQESYVEAYALEHDISYVKYTLPVEPEKKVDTADLTPVAVRIDEQVEIAVSGIPADAVRVVLYADGEEIGSMSAGGVSNKSYNHTFRAFGQQILTAEAYIDGEVVKLSWEKPVIVTGIRLMADRESAWTGETVNFTVEAYPETAEVNFYAEDLQFGSVSLTENAGTLAYAFTKAGDRQITVHSDSGLKSKTLVLPILCIGQLEQPVLEAEALQYTGHGLVCGWNTTENTDGYVLRVRGANGTELVRRDIADDGSGYMTCTISAEELGGDGIYQLYLMNYGHKYDQNESETITVELTANREPVFRMDKQQVMTGETVTFTFCAFDATAVELWADGEVIETIPLTNSRAVFTRAFAKSGDRQMAIRALREDGWTELSDVQILKVTSLGALGTVQVTAEPEQLLGNSIKASWAAVENADGYVVYFRNEAHETIYQQSTTNCAVSVPATDVTQSGGYYFMVVAHGAGYDQSEGSAGVTVLDHLPGPVIVTPAENEIRTDTAVTLTWQEVAGAESYVVSLARKTDRVDAGGQPVYEKVWTAPNETVNVGSVLSYDLTGLVYGGEYRVAVGAVSTLESGRECIGWSERLFSVEMPKLTVTLKADTLTPNAGGQVTLTAAANHPLTQVALTDETGAPVQTVSSGSEIVNGTRVFTFVISNEKQGGKTYTVTVSGIDELESAQSAAASLDIEWLDADAAVINSVMMESGIAWPDTDTVFTITANANTASVEVYLEKVGGSLLRNAGADQSPEVLRPQPSSGEEKLFFYTVKFEEAGDYILRFIPVNAKDEKGTEYPYPVTVHPKGKLPAPRITNLEQNAVIPSSGYTVEWDPVVLGGGMDFGGYSVTVYVADGTWKPITGQRDVFVGKTCQYTIPALEPGKDYRIEVYTVPEEQTVPSATVSGCDFVEFKAESPEITIVTPAVKSTCLVGSPIMVKGTATGGITKALVRLVTAGQNSKTIPVKDANGKSVDEIVVDVVNGEYSAVLNPVKDLKASAGDETDHAVEVYGFLDGQAIDINGRADSKWSMIDLDMAGTFANGVGGNSWIFTDESIVISVKISNTVNDVKLYDGNVRLDTKADVSNPNCHLFTADDLASRKEGLHVITSKDADTGKVLGTVDVYVVSRADRVQVYCKSGMTATGWLIPRENYSAETSVAITENSHLMQRGICGDYVLVEIDSGVSRFVHKRYLTKEEVTYELIRPQDGEVIDLSKMLLHRVEWDSYPGATRYLVKLIIDVTNKQDKLETVTIEKWVDAGSGKTQSTLFWTVDILKPIEKIRAFSSDNWPVSIKIEAYG